jgi:carbon storage regulator
MLVLSRHKDESIIIDGRIEVTIVDIKGDTVRLGINAPREIDVHRKEIFLAIQKENLEAARAATPDLKGLGSLLSGKRPDDKTGKSNPPK